MAESVDRKVFPMSTFAAYLTGEEYDANRSGIRELLGFMTGMSIDATSEPFAAAMAKAWIYEQNPELTGIKGHADKFGSHVSVLPLPADTCDMLAKVVAQLQDVQAKNKEQASKISDLQKQLSDTQAKLKEASAKVTTYEAQLGAGEKKLQVSEGQIDSYVGKVDSLLAKIEEVIKHGVVTTAAGAAGAAGEAAASGAADAGAVDSPGEVSADFGFGTDGGDGFGF
ncbi:putative phage infection (PIP) family protein YhgE [Desulfobaculum xiamenense]|uniref:Putative phage infection (PIP) family protein YhgE n=1 Tax=Desulfobaculum xiamenense TaxID=995050 RepID=A0A846QL17_9BACT|nr:hypothetical protein [Desulfobaculum xiamenense]NJB68811.1 putative phage infection (PIP) family protein YhgE [Desulfobaculum xiamenense]